MAFFKLSVELIKNLLQSGSSETAADVELSAPREPKDRMLFMGLKRSGKSSIINVVLYKMPPSETMWIPASTAIKKHTLQSHRTYQIWDLPGQIDFLDSTFDTESIFSSAGAIVWIVDAQDDYQVSITRLVETYVQLQQAYPDIKYSVFVHKMDSLIDEGKEDNYGDIVQHVQDDLEDAGIENPSITFHATSVYDHSVYEALSKVLQGLNPYIGTFETLLNTLVSSCRFQKLYLFDVASKLYIGSDTSPPDPAGYQLCADYIDMVLDLSSIYSWDRGQPEGEEALAQRTGVRGVESFLSGMGGYCLLLKEITKSLVLIGFSKEPRFAQEKPTVDYNVQLFEEAISEVLART